MSVPVISVNGLGKKYRIGKAEKRADTVLSAILNGIKQPLENLKQIRSLSKLEYDEASIMWALKNISFEVRQGEVLGIIGRNGAGKSTLLKILSRITEPSEGEVVIHGRIASLLEVGTGFHPELTGRENIYMNGTILGMRRKEIDQKLDEIIDFSGVEKYLDTPVKFYSSGMRVRLGFSVAAHLEPEILIIDEVLAVGDFEFQKKCIGKMDDVAKNEGRTVLFVSHNMAAVKSLCNRGVVLENGTSVFQGRIEASIDVYLKNADQVASREWSLINAPGCDFLKLLMVKVLDVENKISLNHLISNDVKIEFTYEIIKEDQLFTHGFNLFNNHNIHILSSHDKDSATLQIPLNKGVHKKTITIPGNFLAEGGYTCSFAIMRYNPFHVEFQEMDVVAFNIIDEAFTNTVRGNYSGHFPGVTRPLLNWK